MTIRTIKMPYTCSDNEWSKAYLDISLKQSIVTRFAVNRLLEGFSEKDIRLMLTNLRNILSDSWLNQTAIRNASGIVDRFKSQKQTKIVFGKNAFRDYTEGKITKQELKEARTFGISSIGEALYKGNRKFKVTSLTEVTFRPNKARSFFLKINPSNNQKQYIQAIISLSESKLAPITVKLSKTHLHLSFDVSLMKDQNYKPKANRIMGVDMNPNRFAFCIKDKDKLLKSESFDLMELRLHTRKGFSSSSNEKKYLQNKKTYEVIELAHYFVKQAKSLHVEAIALEKLTGMRAATSSKHFNRSVNNDFKRNLFRNTIEKLCAINNIRFIEILPQYTSFMGCVLYGSELPDPISAAACVADAGTHTLNQLNQGTKWTAWFNALVIDPSLYNKSKYLNQWKKEDLCFGSVKELYNSVKSLFGSTEGMSSSYHAFLASCALRATSFKSEKSSVQRIYVL